MKLDYRRDVDSPSWHETDPKILKENFQVISFVGSVAMQALTLNRSYRVQYLLLVAEVSRTTPLV